MTTLIPGLTPKWAPWFTITSCLLVTGAKLVTHWTKEPSKLDLLITSLLSHHYQHSGQFLTMPRSSWGTTWWPCASSCWACQPPSWTSMSTSQELNQILKLGLLTIQWELVLPGFSIQTFAFLFLGNDECSTTMVRVGNILGPFTFCSLIAYPFFVKKKLSKFS